MTPTVTAIMPTLDRDVGPSLSALVPQVRDVIVARDVDREGPWRVFNRVAKLATDSGWLLLTHDDVVLVPGAVGRLLAVAHEADAAVVGGLMRSLRDSANMGVYQAELAVTTRCVPTCLAKDDPTGGFRSVLAVPTSLLLINAALWKHLGGFDDRYAMHDADNDLCLRAWMAGARVVMSDTDMGTHVGSASSDPDVRAADLRAFIDRWRSELPIDDEDDVVFRGEKHKVVRVIAPPSQLLSSGARPWAEQIR